MKTFAFKNGSVEFIKASLCAMGKQDARYYLNNLCIDCSDYHPTLIATNGHKLTKSDLVWDQDIESFTHEAGTWLLPREACEWVAKIKAPKPKPENYSGLELTVTFDTDEHGAGTVTCTAYGQSVAVKCIGGNYPDWGRVMPATPAPITTTGFNPSYLADVDKWASALAVAGENNGTVKMTAYGEEQAVIFAALSGKHLLLLLPCRVRQ